MKPMPVQSAVISLGLYLMIVGHENKNDLLYVAGLVTTTFGFFINVIAIFS